MSLIHHILFVVAYTLVSAVVAISLPQVMPRVGQVPAAVFGVVFLAGSALLHEVFLPQEGESRMAERLRELQIDFDEIRRRLNRVLDRFDGLQREVKVVEAQAVKGRERGHEVETVIAEREGLITVIDSMLLFRCVQLVRKSQHQNAIIGFFCNISAHSLTDRHFFRNFVEFVADNTVLVLQPDLRVRPEHHHRRRPGHGSVARLSGGARVPVLDRSGQQPPPRLRRSRATASTSS